MGNTHRGAEGHQTKPKKLANKIKTPNTLSLHGDVQHLKAAWTARRFVPGFPSVGMNGAVLLRLLQWKNTLRAPAGKSPVQLYCYSERDLKNEGDFDT